MMMMWNDLRSRGTMMVVHSISKVVGSPFSRRVRRKGLFYVVPPPPPCLAIICVRGTQACVGLGDVYPISSGGVVLCIPPVPREQTI